MKLPEPGVRPEDGLDFPRAFAEASRCLLCHDAPCSKGCPAGTDPGTFIRKLRMHNIKGAIRTIKQNNVLGGACGILCPTSRLCEEACCAAGLERPVRIGAIQRFLVEHAWQVGFSPLKACAPRLGPVAVVGAGPAGLSCAGTLAQQGVAVTVFEARGRLGGVLAYGVPSWRFSQAFLENELDEIRRLGVELCVNAPIDQEGGVERLLEQGFKAVFVAPGCWEPVRLVEGEPLSGGLLSSTDFLAGLRDGREAELGAMIRGKAVAVLGGGSVAMDCAGSALRLGAAEVNLVYRRSYQQMPAELEERAEAMAEGVHFHLLNQPKRYVRDEAGAICAVMLEHTRLGEPDASGRRAAEPLPGSEWRLDVSVVIEALGSRPVSGSARWYPSVKVSGGGLVKAEEGTGRTSHPAIFAGGDIVRGPALVVKAVQDGKVAAKGILAYLKGEE